MITFHSSGTRAVGKWVCSSAGRAAVSKAAGRGFDPLRTRKCKINVEESRKL